MPSVRWRRGIISHFDQAEFYQFAQLIGVGRQSSVLEPSLKMPTSQRG